LAENPGELLPTIRSRSMIVPLAALPAEEIERYLAKHRADWNPKQRALVARLSEGAVGRARSFDLAAYTAARSNALTLLNSALRGTDHSELFKVTETYRGGAEGRDKTENLLRTLYSLLQDLTFLNSGTPEFVRNTDIQSELKKLAESTDFDWIVSAAWRLAEVERGMRRNLMRSLSLDACATALERG
jgi:DNA polymerase-3 subunit delta'